MDKKNRTFQALTDITCLIAWAQHCSTDDRSNSYDAALCAGPCDW